MLPVFFISLILIIVGWFLRDFHVQNVQDGLVWERTNADGFTEEDIKMLRSMNVSVTK